MRAIITCLTCIFITIAGFSQSVVEWELSYDGSLTDVANSIR